MTDVELGLLHNNIQNHITVWNKWLMLNCDFYIAKLETI